MELSLPGQSLDGLDPAALKLFGIHAHRAGTDRYAVQDHRAVPEGAASGDADAGIRGFGPGLEQDVGIIPLRITVGRKSLADGVVEFKRRTSDNVQKITPDQVARIVMSETEKG